LFGQVPQKFQLRLRSYITTALSDLIEIENIHISWKSKHDFINKIEI
jgi:hypothetical protein